LIDINETIGILVDIVMNNVYQFPDNGKNEQNMFQLAYGVSSNRDTSSPDNGLRMFSKFFETKLWTAT
jgi:hypothetical protein